MNDEPSNYSTAGLPKIAWGRGVRLYDVNGKEYIDGSGGPAVFCLGHSHPEVNEAIKAQLDRVAHGYRYDFSSDPLEQLSEIIRGHCGQDLQHMVFVSSGSDAVESALSLALQYQTAIGEKSRRRIIARKRSWHGVTLGALSASEFHERRKPFEGALLPASHISATNVYRPPEHVAPDNIVAWCANELDQEIQRLGPQNVAAFIFEPVVGAAGGVVPAPPGYARLMREVCNRHGVLMIADEVMCGSGRCGTWRALENDGVVPDIMAVAKGLAGGYVPLGAAIYSTKISEAIRTAHGAPLTGHTFTGHTLACTAGVAVQKIIERDKLLERVKANGPHFIEMLKGTLSDLDSLGDVRGRGHFIGLEFVADRSSKAPFAAELQLHARIKATSRELGLICYPCHGNVDGKRGDTVILAPPYNASDDELAEIVDKLDRSVRLALRQIGR